MELPESITLAFGWLAYQFTELQPFIPMYLHLIVSAVFPIYAGAHSSLSRPSSAAKPKTVKKKDGTTQLEEDEEGHRMESLSPTDALIFPIGAGCTLAGLYFLIKWLGDLDLLNKILNIYFAMFSVFAISKLVADGLDFSHSLIFPRAFVDRGILFRVSTSQRSAVSVSRGINERRTVPLPGWLSRVSISGVLGDVLWRLQSYPHQKLTLKLFVYRILDLRLKFSLHDVVGICAGLSGVVYYNFVAKPWPLTNLMGFGFAYGALQLMSPAKFSTGTMILVGLFAYDIYFVFYTPMMVTVAKSLDIPIKLLFPRPKDPHDDPSVKSLGMLGLGDIVLPGMIIGLALRFDLFLFYLKKQTIQKGNPNPAEDSNSVDKADQTRPNGSGSDALVPAEETKRIVKAPYQSVAYSWGERLWTWRSSPRGRFPKRYFHAGLAGYLVGMVATVLAMQVSNHPQPALLYLVPCVLLSIWSTAWIRGELKEMTKFDDSEEDTDEQKDKTKAVKKSDKDAKDKDEQTASGEDEKTEEKALEISKSGPAVKDTDKADDEAPVKGTDHLVSFSITFPPSQALKATDGTTKAQDSGATSGELADHPQWRPSSNKGTDAEHVDKKVRLS